MNKQAFEAGKTAYQAGIFIQAADLLKNAKEPGEVSGQIDHLLGNCYMRMARYEDAAACYGDALRDRSYGNSGGLACNRGRALLAAGRLQDAIASLTMATKDGSYSTPFKAYLALGDAYLAAGDARDAGVAYRNAAIDESNPAPSVALCKLGNCFMQLGRANDAIEAYRTALDFATPSEGQGEIFANMGMAYVSANRMAEASDAFSRASGAGYALTSEQVSASEAARKALAQVKSGPSETDALLEAWRSGANAPSAEAASPEIDPLDPLGRSGEFIPSPEDTGFFSFDEEEVLENDKKARRKHRHSGLRAFFILVFLLLIVVGVAAYAYYRGYGWPQQQDVASQYLVDYSSGADATSLISSALDDDARAQLLASTPSGVAEVTSATVTQRSMSSTTVLVEAKLTDGGTLAYTISLGRDGISWKVTGIRSESAAIGTDPVVLSPSDDTEAGSATDGVEADTDTTESAESLETTEQQTDESTDTEGDTGAEG